MLFDTKSVIIGKVSFRVPFLYYSPEHVCASGHFFEIYLTYKIKLEALIEFEPSLDYLRSSLNSLTLMIGLVTASASAVSIGLHS